MHTTSQPNPKLRNKQNGMILPDNNLMKTVELPGSLRSKQNAQEINEDWVQFLQNRNRVICMKFTDSTNHPTD